MATPPCGTPGNPGPATGLDRRTRRAPRAVCRGTGVSPAAAPRSRRQAPRAPPAWPTRAAHRAHIKPSDGQAHPRTNLSPFPQAPRRPHQKAQPRPTHLHSQRLRPRLTRFPYINSLPCLDCRADDAKWAWNKLDGHRFDGPNWKVRERRRVPRLGLGPRSPLRVPDAAHASVASQRFASP